ncbi:MAG: TetR/AcrR family transcriptional regulator [Bdellovibrionota bacterium]
MPAAGKAAKAAKLKRKDPKQKRSSVLVDALLETATRILSKRELDETSTNQIAELAGISIGSFYQYFPNKESLASAVMAKILEVHAGFDEELEKKNPNAGPEEKIKITLDYFFSHFMKHRTLFRVLGRHVFRINQFENLVKTRLGIKDAIARSILKSQPSLATERAEAMAWVTVTSVAGVLESIAFIDISDEKVSAVQAETEKMLISYLHLSSN